MKSRRERFLTLGEFRTVLLSILHRIGQLDTQRPAIEEMKLLLRESPSEDKMNLLLNQLQDNSAHLTQLHKREYIKLLGTIAEILEADCLPFYNKILGILQKKIKEGDMHLHESISTAYGMLIHNTIHTIPDLPASCSQLYTALKPLFSFLQGPNKNAQIGSALSLTKLIQHSPIECLKFMLETIAPKLLDIINLPQCKSHNQLLESLISLILSVEQDYSPYTFNTIPTLLNCLNSEDFNTRKQAVDALYTIGAVVADSTAEFAGLILSELNKARTDRSKPVRDSALEALNLYKELAPDFAKIAHSEKLKPQKVKKFQKNQDNRQGSIFQSKANSAFFKAAPKDEIVIEAPKQAQPSSEEEYIPEQFEIEESVHETPIHAHVNLGHLLNQENPEQPKTRTLQTEPLPSIEINYEEQEQDSALNDRVDNLERQNLELMQSLARLQKSTFGELSQINNRMQALEEMINTVAQLFEAKYMQLSMHLKSDE